ncbi:MFS general substrate transporter [Periconia macrospinosa]|uniref:MFS general substrate transporter n=1 Tax=Periconia macrospinosa TaxID=97972 RepID=A0A2V1D3Y0_9PLEO|nr:MFS general substrate transporter [Periconia macrospinosa]
MEKNAPVDGASATTPMDSSQVRQYPSAGKTWIIMLCLYITMFLVALDKSILGTAMPRISDQFNSLSSIGWYASSYMLTLCAFQLIWGRIYTFYSVKLTFVTAVVIFEVGSAICGAAPTSPAFIVGRSISGLGSAGITNGAIIVIMETVPLEKRPVFQGLLGAVFGIASVVGPLLGGVLTDRLSWRWCFYINLPFGAVAIALLPFLLQSQPKAKTDVTTTSFIQKLKQMDPLGTALFLPSVVCLVLALQWGGTTYAWSNWRVILLLVLAVLLAIGFAIVQVFMPDTATIPPRVMKGRTMLGAALFCICCYASILILSFYVPIFFQAIQNFSPTKSGLATLPSILGLFIGTVLAGVAVQRLGYPAPAMILSAVFTSVGAGLITTWPVDVGSSMWIGYQFISGFGAGLGMQQPNLLAQIVLADEEDATMGVSFMFFVQNLGGAVFISIAQSVFTDTLATELSKIPGLHLSRQQIVEMGATNIKNLVSTSSIGLLLEGYRIAIRNTFYLGLTLSCLSMVAAVMVEWRSVKKEEKSEGDVEKVTATAD